MPDLTMISTIAHTCTVTLSDPTLIVAWARTIAGDIQPDTYMSIFKALNPTDVDAVSNAQSLVDYCMGQGS